MSIVEITQQNLSKLQQNSDLAELFDKLDSCGPSLILGGAVRDWSLGKNPRDIDIVIDCKANKLEFLLKYKAKKNNFGGYKLQVAGTEFDIWSLETTWALKHDSKLASDLFSIPKTVFLNTDAIGYCPDTKQIYENGFSQAMEQRVLDVVYEPNPYPFMCVSKGLCTLLKYDLKPSDKLKEYVANQLGRGYTKKSFDKFNELSGTNYDYQESFNRLGL